MIRGMNETVDQSAPPARLADGSEPCTPEDLFIRLDDLGIAYRTVEHAPLYTVEDSRALRGDLPGGHTKNLFLRNKKGGMWLVTCLEERAIDLKDLGERLQAGRLSFGRPERLMQHLGVIPGAVTPFAVINDRQEAVQMVLDSALLDHDPLNFHPLDNARTTALSPRDLLRFLESAAHYPQVISLD